MCQLSRNISASQVQAPCDDLLFWGQLPWLGIVLSPKLLLSNASVGAFDIALGRCGTGGSRTGPGPKFLHVHSKSIYTLPQKTPKTHPRMQASNTRAVSSKRSTQTSRNGLEIHQFSHQVNSAEIPLFSGRSPIGIFQVQFYDLEKHVLVYYYFQVIYYYFLWLLLPSDYYYHMKPRLSCGLLFPNGFYFYAAARRHFYQGFLHQPQRTLLGKQQPWRCHGKVGLVQGVTVLSSFLSVLLLRFKQPKIWILIYSNGN